MQWTSNLLTKMDIVVNVMLIIAEAIAIGVFNLMAYSSLGVDFKNTMTIRLAEFNTKSQPWKSISLHMIFQPFELDQQCYEMMMVPVWLMSQCNAKLL